MHVGHLPLTALEPNLRRNQGGAFRKDRQLQLRHASILPSPSLSRKRTGGQLIFQNGSQNHGMRSGVLNVRGLRKHCTGAFLGGAAGDSCGGCCAIKPAAICNAYLAWKRGDFSPFISWQVETAVRPIRVESCCTHNCQSE